MICDPIDHNHECKASESEKARHGAGASYLVTSDGHGISLPFVSFTPRLVAALAAYRADPKPSTRSEMFSAATENDNPR